LLIVSSLEQISFSTIKIAFFSGSDGFKQEPGFFKTSLIQYNLDVGEKGDGKDYS